MAAVLEIEDSSKFVFRNCVYLELPLAVLTLGCYIFQELVKSFKVAESPVRSAKFIACKQWVVTGADDKSVAVHPTLPYVLSASDDMLIKLWDWEKGWQCTQTFQGHAHYVMQVAFSPKDANTFASASLDGTIKVWNLSSPAPDFTLDGHSKGVNCIDYFMRGSKPYLISGSDDHTAKVWDYEAKSCSEDGNVHIWDGATYRLENTLNYGFERVWAFGCMKGSNRVVIGYDKGTIMIKVLSSHSGGFMGIRVEEEEKKEC
ncbi:Coatomer subunit beta'-1 [Vitis vinifera]|uniref:Coatomer subunit beta'-1 n=1 Tax=Vitis vinifera TaxID=29760 RepID=A0A438E0Z2_VITVI|nr:Coatomer subunit beta'-1 [Vitis vinifera]